MNKMNAKIFVVLSTIAFSNSLPVSYGNVPAVMWRVGRAPNVAFGFGSGFSSNIGGISQSQGIGASFQSGDATAYGAGIGSTNGNFARGIGYANAAPSFGLPHQNFGGFNNGFIRPFSSSISSAQNIGSLGSAISSTIQDNGLGRFQSAISSAQNLGGYGSAVSSSSSNGLGFGSAVSSAQNLGGYGSTFSLAQGRGLNNYGSAVSASQNFGGIRATAAQASQIQGGSLQHSGASSINGPGIQAAQSQAINNGYY